MPSATEQRFEKVQRAFAADGFDTVPVPDPDRGGAMVPFLDKWGRIAARAAHRKARNTKTGEPKAAYYVEGTNYQMGWFMGAISEPAIERMATDYCENVIFDFFALEGMVNDRGRLATRIKDAIFDLIYHQSQPMIADVPFEYVEELKGMVDGCRAAHAGTKVAWDRLWGLNYGIDCLIAHMYTGKLFADGRIKPHRLRVPIMCNAFAITGGAAEAGRPLFGRDFMFPTAGVFQDVACIVIQKPDPLNGTERRLVASQTAPGIIGSVVALNDEGLAIGIDMNPSSYCDPARPGFNSLGLNRDVAHYSATAREAVGRVRATQRGVSWFYPLADRSGDACILEAGRKPAADEDFPWLDPVPAYYKRRLPDRDYFDRIGVGEPTDGVFERGKAYDYPGQIILDCNRRLFRAFNRNLLDRLKLVLHDLGTWWAKWWKGDYRRDAGACFRAFFGAFFTKVRWKNCDSGERGFYCRTSSDWNVPGPYYFAPQREVDPEIVLLTNHQIHPGMRLQSMTKWLTFITCGNQVDFQWRYDALNKDLLDERDKGPLGLEAAWKLIDFLDPLRGKYPWYNNPDGAKDPKDCLVHGSVNLIDLEGRKIRSLWGYYGDDWVEIQLLGYR